MRLTSREGRPLTRSGISLTVQTPRGGGLQARRFPRTPRACGIRAATPSLGVETGRGRGGALLEGPGMIRNRKWAVISVLSVGLVEGWLGRIGAEALGQPLPVQIALGVFFGLFSALVFLEILVSE